MALKWYMVDITVRDPRGGRRRIETVAKAQSAADAAIQVAQREWGIDLTHSSHWQHRNGYTLDHETLEETATEVTDPVVLARLNSDPPPWLDLTGMRVRGGDAPAAEAASGLPWFKVDLKGVTANDRVVRHCSTRRALAADVALKQALEEVFDLPHSDGRWMRQSPPGARTNLFLELVSGGVSWPLWVEARAMLDIVSEVAPPSWATPDDAPDAYQRQALATWGSGDDSVREQRFHALLGLTGEVGEVANLVKKQLYKPGVVDDGAAVIDELADVAYYLAVLASLYGVTFDGLFAHLGEKLAGGHGWVER